MELMMRNILSNVVATICVMFFVQGHASQTLVVHIAIDSSKSFRREAIDPHELQKWGRFYGEQAPPFEQYFRIASTFCVDYFYSNADFSFTKDLLKKVPFLVRQDSTMTREQRRQYQFPKYISKSLLEKIQTMQCSCSDTCFMQKIYKNKETNKALTLIYTT
jgi:hypothetical protein